MLFYFHPGYSLLNPTLLTLNNIPLFEFTTIYIYLSLIINYRCCLQWCLLSLTISSREQVNAERLEYFLYDVRSICKMVTPIYSPTSGYERSRFPHILTNTRYYQYFHFHTYVETLHLSPCFYLHFLN